MARKSAKQIAAESGLRQLQELASMNMECRELEGQREATAQLLHFTADANRWLEAVKSMGWSDRVPEHFTRNAAHLKSLGWRLP